MPPDINDLWRELIHEEARQGKRAPLSTKEAVRYLGCSRKKIYRLIRAGKLRRVPMYRKVHRFDLRDLQKVRNASGK